MNGSAENSSREQSPASDIQKDEEIYLKFKQSVGVDFGGEGELEEVKDDNDSEEDFSSNASDDESDYGDWEGEELRAKLFSLCVNKGDDPKDEEWVPSELLKNNKRKSTRGISGRPTKYIKGPNVMSKSSRTQRRYRKQFQSQTGLESFGFSKLSAPPNSLASQGSHPSTESLVPDHPTTSNNNVTVPLSLTIVPNASVTLRSRSHRPKSFISSHLLSNTPTTPHTHIHLGLEPRDDSASSHPFTHELTRVHLISPPQQETSEVDASPIVEEERVEDASSTANTSSTVLSSLQQDTGASEVGTLMVEEESVARYSMEGPIGEYMAEDFEDDIDEAIAGPEVRKWTILRDQIKADLKNKTAKTLSLSQINKLLIICNFATLRIKGFGKIAASKRIADQWHEGKGTHFAR
ncbi:hypothetical protein CPC08DRAFT_768942 [Agrocybe pediades]|nr:hypothetical protein CPC08DRAFT_768942 [Agrocybe pediades]